MGVEGVDANGRGWWGGVSDGWWAVAKQSEFRTGYPKSMGAGAGRKNLARVGGISNYKPGEVWDEITYPFLNFNGATVEV